MASAEALIDVVLSTLFPSYEPPDDRSGWAPCRCPVHGESRPSAAVHREYAAFKCLACGYQGDVLAILMREEDLSFGAAIERAEKLAVEFNSELPESFERITGRGVPSRSGSNRRGGGKARAGVRSRTTPWA